METRTELERVVSDMHHAHYSDNPNGLVNPDQSPSENIIYRVWNDGEITYEKGGDVFGDRSLKQLCAGTCIFESDKSKLPTFPLSSSNGYSYAILTMQECLQVGRLLKVYFDAFMPKRFEVRLTTTATIDDEGIRKLSTKGIRVLYRSPANDMMIVQSLAGTTEEELFDCFPEGSITFTRVD